MFDLVPIARAAVLENVADPVFVLDARDRVADLNPAAQHALGLDARRAIGQAADRLFGARPELLEQCRAAGTVHTEIGAGPRERRRVYDLSSVPIRNERGQYAGRLLVLHDVTELKRAENTARVQRDLGIALNEARDLPGVASRVLEAVCRIDGIDYGAVYADDSDSGEAGWVGQRGLSAPWAERAARPAPPSGRDEPLYGCCPNVPLELEARWRGGLQAFALIPLRCVGRTSATLVLASPARAEFPADTRRALEAMANQAGAAIDRIGAERALQALNADLERRVSRRTAELEASVRDLAEEIAERRRVEAALREAEETLAQRVADQSRKMAALYEVILMGGQSLEAKDLLEQSWDKVAAAMGGQAGCIHLWDGAGTVLGMGAHRGFSEEAQGRIAVLPDDWLPADGRARLVPGSSAAADAAPPGLQSSRVRADVVRNRPPGSTIRGHARAGRRAADQGGSLKLQAPWPSIERRAVPSDAMVVDAPHQTLIVGRLTAKRWQAFDRRELLSHVYKFCVVFRQDLHWDEFRYFWPTHRTQFERH